MMIMAATSTETIRRLRQSMSQKMRRRSDNRPEQFILSLPEHLVLSCLARVPMSSYQSMREVCRAWKRMLEQRHFWKLRHDFNTTDEMVLLCILHEQELESSRRELTAWHGFVPLSNTWFRVPPMPEDGRVPASSACATLDGKLFVIGGEFKHSGVSCKTVSYFDVRDYRWKTAAPLNIPRSNCKVAVIENKLYVFGGFTVSSAAAQGNAASQGNGNAAAQGNRVRKRFSTASAYQNSGVFLQSAEVYDPVIGSWRLLSNTKIPAPLDHRVVMDGKLFAMGRYRKAWRTFKDPIGDWTRAYRNTGAIFDPQRNEWTRMSRRFMSGFGIQSAELNGRLFSGLNCHCMRFYDSSKKSWQSVEIKWPWDDEMVVEASPKGLVFGSLGRLGGSYAELLTSGGKLCMMGVDPELNRAFVAVLDMEERLSQNNDVGIHANVLSLEDITDKVKDHTSGFPSLLKGLLACQVIEA